VRYLAALELRRRWRRLLAQAVLVGVTSAVVLATAAGARRTDTALDRFKATTLSADLELAVGEPTADDVDRLRAVPEVASAALLRAFGLSFPDLPALEAIGVPADAAYGTTIDRARLVRGRAVDPTVPDEVALGESLAAQLHVDVGGVIRARAYTPDQIAAILGGAGDVGEPVGPPVALRVVGINRRPLDLSDRATSGGFLVLSPAFATEWAGRIGEFGGYVRIRLVDGQAGVPATIDAARRIFGDRQFSTQSLTVESEGARAATHVNTVSLWLLAGVAALAGSLAVGLVIAREVALLDGNGPTLRALGVTRTQRLQVAGALAGVVATAGCALAIVAAVAASPLFPTGVARRADPALGLHADALVLGLGALATATVVLGVAALSGWRSTRPVPVAARDARRPSPVVAGAARMGLSPTLTTGLRMAIERRRGGRPVPVRSGHLGAVVAVLGTAGVLVFAANLDHLTGSPPLYGSSWDFLSQDVTSNTSCGAGDFGLAGVTGVRSIAEVCYKNLELEGRPTPIVSFATLRGPAIEPEVLEGHPPRSAGEIALGSKTLAALDKHVGDTVSLRSTIAERSFTIVGRVIMPTLGQAQPVADGAVVTGEGMAPLFDSDLFFRYFAGTFGTGGDLRSVAAQIATIDQLGPPVGPTLPVEVERVRQVDWAPATLAVLIGVLGLVAVAHALATAVRRRRDEFAVLKTLGFTRAQVRRCIAWQATTLAVVGALVGIPAGLLVGNVAWRAVADSIGVDPSAVLTARVLIAVPGVLALANLVAVAPARAAARTRPALALRAE
jgi:hypothetical protein